VASDADLADVSGCGTSAVVALSVSAPAVASLALTCGCSAVG
jgi:hypothetical protein